MLSDFHLLLLVLLLPFAAALVVAALRLREAGGWIALGTAVACTVALWKVEAGHYYESSWTPMPGVQFSFLVDGLSRLFGLLVGGMGALIFLYALGYLGPKFKGQSRFYALLLLFMGAMLGSVLVSAPVLFFTFWEMTGMASFLLIGFNAEGREAREGARTALLITFGTGLCLLVAICLIGRGGPGMLMLLIMIAALGKSAQFPFHFWLPGAMSAPTPVSAYLHSATLVNLGIYLMARSQLLGTLPADVLTLIGFGTMLLGALLAFASHDLKTILAWSTVSALGGIFGFYGAGGTTGDGVQILSHAGYKAALFMLAGIVDHACGTRDLRQLGGLGRKMPLLAVIGAITLASMAGIPGTPGFVAKELLLTKVLSIQGPLGWYALLCLLGSAALMVAIAARLFLHLFYGAYKAKAWHSPSPLVLISPTLLATAVLAFGVRPQWFGTLLHALGPMEGRGAEVHSYALWHGWNRPLSLSLAAIFAGVGLYFLGQKRGWRFEPVVRWLDFAPAFQRGHEWLLKASARLTRLSGAQNPTCFLPIMLGTALALVLTFVAAAVVMEGDWKPTITLTLPDPVRTVIALLIAACVLAVPWFHGRIAALVALSASGFLVSFYFLLYRAPDLALTQVVVETALLFLVVMLLRTLPDRPSPRPPRSALWLAVAVGAIATVAILIAGAADPIGPKYLEMSRPLAGGRNAVNTILVDFRGFDTLGEIAVLVIAMLGALGLVKGTRHREGPWLESFILRQLSLLLVVPVNLLALWLLLRGHDAPGGGFIAGGVTALSLVMLHLAIGRERFGQLFPWDPLRMAGYGFLIALITPLLPTASGGWFFQRIAWEKWPLLSTTFLFDLGVYLVVTGVIAKLITTLAPAKEEAA